MRDRKHILFVCYGLGIGGIEKCLVNLLNVLPENRYSVDVLLMNPEYAMKPQIKRDVHYLDTFSYVLNIEDTISEIKKRGGFLRNLRLFLKYVGFRLRIKLRFPAWTVFRALPEHYDIAVAYSQNGFAPYYVIDKVQADRKVLWYHNGAYEKTGKEYKRDKGYYNRFDHVVAVSSDCAKVLQKKFGFDDKKLLILRNICDSKSIQENARAFVPSTYTDAQFHIATVGRLTSEKGADLALQVCRQLCDEGKDICWHWVGDGNQTKNIADKVKDLELQERFILEGNQTNPYPYMLYADIYVQPSYYEAYSTTVTEAKALCKPIVTTDVGGMRDQLVDGENGMIVPVNANAMADAIRVLMDNQFIRSRFSSILKRESYDPTDSLAAYEKTVFS